MADVIRGPATQDSINQEALVVDMKNKIYDPELNDGYNDRAFTKIFHSMGKGGTVTQRKFKVQESSQLQREFPIKSLTAPEATTITIDTAFASQLQPRDKFMNLNTDEYFMAITVNTVSGEVYCVRDLYDHLGTPSASTAADDVLRYIGNAREEGGLADSSITKDTDISYNYTSFIRTAVEATDHEKNTLEYGGNQWERRRNTRLVNHMEKIENTVVLGIRGKVLDPVDGKKYIYDTGGIKEHIKGNVFSLATDYGGLVTERALDHLGELLIQNNDSGEIHVFSGVHFMSGMTSVAKKRLTLNDSLRKRYGIIMNEYLCSSGLVLQLVSYPKMFTGYGKTTAYTGGTLANMALCLEMKKIEIVGMKGMDGVRLHTKIQENDRSGMKDEWRTDIGVRMHPGLDNPCNSPTANIQYASPHGIVTDFDTY